MSSSDHEICNKLQSQLNWRITQPRKLKSNIQFGNWLPEKIYLYYYNQSSHFVVVFCTLFIDRTQHFLTCYHFLYNPFNMLRLLQSGF